VTSNDAVARRLEEYADRLAAQGVEYKPRSYRKAAETVREQPRSVAELVRADPDAVEALPDIGDAIGAKIREFVETGEIEELEELRAEMPVDIDALLRVEGVGPKTVGTLYEELGIEDLDDLQAAAEAGEIREVTGFGPKTEENILDGIEFAREAHERSLLGDARPLAEAAMALVDGVDGVERVETAGSIRRWKETVGDVDVLAAAADPAPVVERLRDWDRAETAIEAGEQKASVRVEGVRVDLRVVDPAEFGAALQYFTGSWDHNVVLRERAVARDLKMNEYGVFDVSGVEDPDADQRAGERIAGETEAGMYEALDLPWMAPELRRAAGEVAAADAGALPDLVETGAIRGDLHTHTDWSDGGASVAEMVAAAADVGHEYHCVTDHGAGPGVLPDAGLDVADLREQAAEVAAVREDAPIPVLHGVEANVDADGEVHPDPDALADLDLDVVVASPHSALDQGAVDATERLVAAASNPLVDVLGHPSGRRINQRAGLEFDVERVAVAAAEHGTALEVNADPARLDLHGDAVKTAVEAGATIVVNTDAHVPAELDNLRYGVHTARRGWAEPAAVLNARDVDGLREFLGS
jgi:DNA polymerase (family 10)